MAESSLSSNNPFRRESLSRAPAPTTEPFRSQLNALPTSAMAPPTTSFQKPKVVKRVRVQSPPPSSPESAGAPEAFPEWPVWPEDHDLEGLDGGQDHVFAGLRNGGLDGSVDEGEVLPMRDDAPPDVSLGQSERLGRKAPALDVSAFSRLLLTGQRQEGSSEAGSSTTQAPGGMAGDSGSITDASSISRQSIFDTAYGIWETPRTSHEISDFGEDEQRELLESRLVKKRHSTLKKKPPPPSSRHGKLIQDKEEAQDGLAHFACSDVNKPLPPAPGAPVLEDAHDSVFDREAAGRVPELDVELDVDPDATEYLAPPRPPTPPKASRAASADGTTLTKPPPPPKRGHGRASSKSLGTGAPGFTLPGDDGDLTPSRSSLESNRSRSSSLRVSTGAPPPPPRRNHAAGRSVSSLTGMPSTGSEREPYDDKNLAGGGASETSDLGADGPAPGVKRKGSVTSLNAKPWPPPPPPARTASLRSGRKLSVSSVEATPLRASREKSQLSLTTPPPPPPRQRGNSRGSQDGPAQFSRRASLESDRIMEEADEDGAGDGAGDGADSAADDILAHLDALQREVDALRAQQERGA